MSAMDGGFIDLLNDHFGSYTRFFSKYENKADFFQHVKTPLYPVAIGLAATIAVPIFLAKSIPSLTIHGKEEAASDIKLASIALAIAITEGVITAANAVLFPTSLITRGSITAFDKLLELSKSETQQSPSLTA